jgi:hypothetical protein
MRIRKSLGTLLILLFFATCSASAVQPRYSVKINALSDVFHLGEEVRVKATVTNTTNQPITLIDTGDVCDYVLEVRDETGKIVPDTHLSVSIAVSHTH